ncbi:hypothetical protein, partial [Microcoleus sp. D3_18a_C4]|uniref:hypothetical protein n=1 Tax=unclassified Microcoleus TaxID=2642155 RepID=UPI002FD5ED7B
SVGFNRLSLSRRGFQSPAGLWVSPIAPKPDRPKARSPQSPIAPKPDRPIDIIDLIFAIFLPYIRSRKFNIRPR